MVFVGVGGIPEKISPQYLHYEQNASHCSILKFLLPSDHMTQSSTTIKGLEQILEAMLVMHCYVTLYHVIPMEDWKVMIYKIGLESSLNLELK